MKQEKTKSNMLIISMGFLFLYLAFAWHWAVFVSFAVGIVGIISPFLSRKLEWTWMKLAEILGYIIPNLLLTVAFYLFLYPLALLSRLSRKDPLMLSRNHSSYFIDIRKKTAKDSFEKIW